MSEPDGAVRVLLVDDQELVRSGLRLILRRRDGFVIAGECGDGAEVPDALAATEVDVIVMDLRMKQIDGIEATRRLRRAGNHPPVLALTTFDDDELLAGALRAGVAGYVLKDSSAEDLIRAVRTVAAGEAWLDTSVTARVLSTYRAAAPSLQDDSAAASPEELTPREFDVLRAVGRGLANAEIASALRISELTVKSHLGRVLTKLGLRDRPAAIVYAFDHGIVAPTSVRPDAAPEPPTVTQRPAEGQLRLAVLGPLRAWRGDELVDLGPVRQQAMLAALVLRPDVTVSQQELLAYVWGLEPPGTGGKVVPVYLYRLRKCLQVGDSGPNSVLDRDRGGYRFASGSAWVDVAALEDIVAEADAVAHTSPPTHAASTHAAPTHAAPTQPIAQSPGHASGVSIHSGGLAEAVYRYTRALELFQGEPLAGLPGPFAAGERLRLTERKLALSLRKLGWQLRLGEYAEAIGELSTLSHAHPHSEPITALLMRAFYRAGRRADALSVFTALRRRLVDDLGIEPGEELRRVQQAVLSSDDAALDADLRS
jgi:DNA-binding NarL/FixJ family response regulator/DNA-binding SARP family transcriptional activator